MYKQRKGFTLIEILVVVTIIGILASMTLLGLGPARRSGQDARRIADIRNVQGILEVFFNQKGGYPNCPTAADAPGAAANYTGCLTTTLTSAGLLRTGQRLPNDADPNKVYGFQGNISEYYLGAFVDLGLPPGHVNPTIPAAFAGMDAYCSDTTLPTISYCVQNP